MTSEGRYPLQHDLPSGREPTRSTYHPIALNQHVLQSATNTRRHSVGAVNLYLNFENLFDRGKKVLIWEGILKMVLDPCRAPDDPLVKLIQFTCVDMVCVPYRQMDTLTHRDPHIPMCYLSYNNVPFCKVAVPWSVNTRIQSTNVLFMSICTVVRFACRDECSALRSDSLSFLSSFLLLCY